MIKEKIHNAIAYTITLPVLFLIDIPIKGLLLLLYIIISFLNSLFYPITKYLKRPSWMSCVYNYATSKKQTLARIIWKAWH